MQKDPLYFPRTTLAQALLSSMRAGISHAFTLFAPRRMGKTQFLLKDMKPLAEAEGFNVFYFSFMDDASVSIAESFQQALYQFSRDIQATEGVKSFLGGIKRVDILGVGVERAEPKVDLIPKISDLMHQIAMDNLPSLLLLDEIQELTRISEMEGLVRSLRTGLDMYQQQIKTIFTGSSANDLRMMFNNSKAPFFHFAHEIDFPVMGRDFSDFLADIYHQRTSKELDKEALYQIFEQVHHTPLYLRTMIQDMIINPELSLEVAAENRLEQIYGGSEYVSIWNGLSPLEKEILQIVLTYPDGLYSKENREIMAHKLGLDALSTSQIQGGVRKLERKNLLASYGHGGWYINPPMFGTWLKSQAL